jgi:N6-adenosine-specific RNA methylase IME4
MVNDGPLDVQAMHTVSSANGVIASAQVLVADPPWRFGDKLPGAGRGAERHYTTMSVDELCGFELPPLADDAYLFMWRVSSMVEEAYAVVRSWGFVPKSEIVWQKLTKTGKPWFGMGHHVRASHETCVVATRGRPRPLVRRVRSTFSAPVPVDVTGKYIHSAKPEAFYDLVEQLAAGPYTELFARRRRPGWFCLGNQVPMATQVGASAGANPGDYRA